ncbi:MAG: DUF4380 domain-containing protein [Clostridiales bacterium]|nr:DUF4380 domain-containing protein [Clostridiales bacterium]
MSNISIAPYGDAQWGNCVKMTNGVIELLVTVDFGPRVIHLSRVGKENMMYQDFSRGTLGEKQKEYNDHLKLCGGHRLWISPEVLPRCYYPDSAPVEWVAVNSTARFTAPVETFNNIQKIIEITMIEDEPAVQVEHIIKNMGAWDIEFAHWCITMLDKGGKEIIPMPKRRTGYLANRNISLWDYSEMNDSRIYWGKDFITLTQDAGKVNPFKLGLNNEDGWVAYFNKGQVFVKYFDPVAEGCYPDNGCTFESYANAVMLECETLSELVYLEPGEESSFTEEWELYDAGRVPSNDEKEIADIINQHVST